MKNLRKTWSWVVTHMVLISMRITGSFFDLFTLFFIKWGRNDLKLLFNSILENTLKKVEQPSSRKSQKETSLKEQKKCLINFPI